MHLARFDMYAKNKYIKLYIFREHTISGIQYMRMKSIESEELIILSPLGFCMLIFDLMRNLYIYNPCIYIHSICILIYIYYFYLTK